MRILFLLFLVNSSLKTYAQTELPLYEGKIPNFRASPNKEYSKPNTQVDTLTLDVSIPTMRIFLPQSDGKNRAAVIICPGGGYGVLLTKREGSDVAKAFNRQGIVAIVLKYRLPNPKTMINTSIGPLQDALKAIKMVRNNAEKWGIDPKKIGIMGFSAGGHLASTAGTHFDKLPDFESREVRPDFMLLINPVISFSDSIGHRGSRDNLLGPNPSSDQIRLYSNELQISAGTPPTFLVHSGADVVVPVKNSLFFYQALLKHGVSADLHIYSRGEHGFLTYPSFDEWFGRCLEWLKSEHIK